MNCNLHVTSPSQLLVTSLLFFLRERERERVTSLLAKTDLPRPTAKYASSTEGGQSPAPAGPRRLRCSRSRSRRSRPGGGGRGGGGRRRGGARGGARSRHGRAAGGGGGGGLQLRHRHQLPQQRGRPRWHLLPSPKPKEATQLGMLLRNGKENGVEDLQMMERSEAMELEPEIRCVKALLSPSSGIVDSHSLMLSLLGEAENLGTIISYNTTVISGHVGDDGLELHISESKELENHDAGAPVFPQLILLPKLVINSAGLSAVPLAKRFHGLNKESVPPAYYARGCYFTLSQTRSPFGHLIYPIPEDGGLGVHVTLDLNGLVRFGPDVEWLDGVNDDISCFLNRFDYSVNCARSSRFYPEIRKYCPNLKDGSLEPGYSGIRPKLSGPGQPPSDFVIQGEDIHGVPGLVNLFGIESPGLTSSLAIAEYIVTKYLR